MTAGRRFLSFALLRYVAGGQRRAVTEEEILHVFLDELLRLLLERHQAVLVEDHLHPFFPQFPRVGGNVLEDPLSELAWPGWCIQSGELTLEFHAEYLAAGRVPGRRGQ